MAVKYDGTLPSAPNLGSFSLQPLPGARSWQTLYNWVNVATAANWRCTFIVYDAAGVEISPPLGVLPGPAWDNLLPGAWYRFEVQWSVFQNRITRVMITNLNTGSTAVAQPSAWYLGGGANPSLPASTACRLFTGGAIGNIVAWDNLRFDDAGTCYADCNADGQQTIADFGCFQAAFVAGSAYADCNGSGTLTIADFGCFQAAFAGCP